MSAAFVLVRLQRGHRLRLRDEIARTAGAPVIASLDAPSCTTPSAWRDLLEGRPRATTEWALRHVLHSLPNGSRPRPAVRVISFAGDSPALTTGPRLALHAAASGMPTVLIPEAPRESEDRSLRPLRAAFTGAEPVNRGLPFTLGLNDAGQDPPELLVSLVVFDGNSTALTPSDAVNLLSISPNFVTDDELAQLALQAADSGSVLEGVVVVNPDPTDNTTGLMKDDAVRLLPSRVGVDASDDQLVHLRARTSEASGSPDRITEPGDLMEATMSNDDPALGPMIGLRALVATIRRKRRVWLITGLVGLLVGASLHLVVPRKVHGGRPISTWPSPLAGIQHRVMANNVSLLQTEVVAQQAITMGHLHMTPHTLLSHFTGLAVSDNIMSITFSGPSQIEAVVGCQGRGPSVPRCPRQRVGPADQRARWRTSGLRSPPSTTRSTI